MEILSGPIPGENYTSDTKNYPWHREPEFDDLDLAIEYSAKKLTSKHTAASMMALAKGGVPLTSIAQMFLMGGMMRGKWTVDYALLMAGPTVHILSLLAKAAEIEFTYGIEEDPIIYTDTFFEMMEELDAEEQAALSVVSETLGDDLSDTDPSLSATEASGMAPEGPPVPQGGFVGMAAQEAPTAPMAPEAMAPTPEEQIDLA